MDNILFFSAGECYLKIPTAHHTASDQSFSFEQNHATGGGFTAIRVWYGGQESANFIHG